MNQGRESTTRSVLELMEQATHLLRTTSAATMLTYYAGTIPFAFGFLYFWTDMSRSPFAARHSAEGSLGVAALFIWMKLWQAAFARRLRSQLTGSHMPAWSLRRCMRILLVQTIVQPSGLFLIPLALIVALPFGWVYAFYQNVTVLADDDGTGLSELISQCWKQASLWTMENHYSLGITLLFGFVVFLNWALALFAIPSLLKMLFGIETVFSKSPIAMLNTTFFAAICVLTYLTVDPLIKTLYALRCFSGESLDSGEDLKVELRQFAAVPHRYVALLLIVLSFLCGSGMAAQVQSSELDREIDKVIHQDKYTWRMPREGIEEENSRKGPIGRFIAMVGNFLKKTMKATLDWADAFLRRLFNPRDREGNGQGASRLAAPLLYVLLGIVLVGVAVYCVRLRRERNSEPAVIRPKPFSSPDIADENVDADQMPEERWTRLARELIDRGEYRLSLRAFYLSTLAHLAERNLIGIARFKSNRDYENELRRRGHAIPDLVPMFSHNVSTFERIWYGVHAVDRDAVLDFAANVERIKASG
jgi:hypothetical protein